MEVVIKSENIYSQMEMRETFKSFCEAWMVGVLDDIGLSFIKQTKRILDHHPRNGTSTLKKHKLVFKVVEK